MFNILFGYNDKYEFHGPLELIFSYLEVIELVNTSFKVCRNFYLASIESLWKRDIKGVEVEKIFDKKPSEVLVKTLLEKESFDITLDMNRAIRYCSEMGYTSEVKRLLKIEECDPSADDNNAIKRTSEMDHIEVVKILLSDERVDPSADNNYAIKWASRNAHDETFKILQADKRVEVI